MKIFLKLLKWIGIGSLGVLFLFIVLLFWWYYNNFTKPANIAKENLLKHNPQITKVYSLSNVRGWGDGPEYSGIVEINGKRCRIWTYGDGVITDNQCEWNFDVDGKK